MPFTTPKFTEIFESIAADNVLRIVERDFKRGIDYYYLDAATYTTRYGVSNGFVGTGEDLPDFTQRTLGQFADFGYPSFVADPVRNTTSESDDDSHVGNEVHLDLFLAVSDVSAATVTRKLGKYVRALKEVLRAATSADYFYGSSGIVLSIEISSDYLLIGHSADDNLYMRPAHLDLTIKATER